MLQTPLKTEAAIIQLCEALRAEIEELRKAGQERFHTDGLPSIARPLMQCAEQRAKLLEQVESIHAQWRMEKPMPPQAQLKGLEANTPQESKRGVLIRNMEGVSVTVAAQCLGLKPDKVRELLESGTLQGVRPVGGNWKISRAEISDYAKRRNKAV